MPPKIMSLEKVLELSPLSASRFVTTYHPAAPMGGRGTFGGTLVAQSLLASLYTVPNNFLPTSLHCYFITAGNPDLMINYHVEDLRYGRNFIHKQVKAYQHDRLIFTSMILFSTSKESHDSLSHLKKIEKHSIPSHNKFVPAGKLFEDKVIKNAKSYSNISKGFEDPKGLTKFVDNFETGIMEYEFPDDLFYSKVNKEMLEYYLRVRDTVTTSYSRRKYDKITPENDNRYNYVAFAYLSDSYFLYTLPYFHGLPMYSSNFSVSLDHTLYFHQIPSVNNWMYFQVKQPRSHWDKHLMEGEYYDPETGDIIATVAQEGLVMYDPEKEIRAKF